MPSIHFSEAVVACFGTVQSAARPHCADNKSKMIIPHFSSLAKSNCGQLTGFDEHFVDAWQS